MENSFLGNDKNDFVNCQFCGKNKLEKDFSKTFKDGTKITWNKCLDCRREFVEKRSRNKKETETETETI